MDKLTIEHITPYLPFGLKAEMLDHQCDYVGKQYDEIVGVHQWDKNCLYWSVLTIGGSKPNIERIKPILRPMSDITKEEWLEVFKAGYSKEALEILDKMKIDVYIKEYSGTIWLYDVDKGMSIIIPKVYFMAYSIRSRSLSLNKPYSFDSLKFFKELYKLHADVEGLIEKGLAIDINTL